MLVLRSARRGFTLVEVLVASFLTIILFVSAAATLSSVSRAMASNRAKSDAAVAASNILARARALGCGVTQTTSVQTACGDYFKSLAGDTSCNNTAASITSSVAKFKVFRAGRCMDVSLEAYWALFDPSTNITSACPSSITSFLRPNVFRIDLKFSGTDLDDRTFRASADPTNISMVGVTTVYVPVATGSTLPVQLNYTGLSSPLVAPVRTDETRTCAWFSALPQIEGKKDTPVLQVSLNGGTSFKSLTPSTIGVGRTASVVVGP